ncbi:MAG TPA: formate dehydrogenase accessory protein FdhE [Vicinamibacteria bacterium]|nr:formate dehydrogenase accessory protein FdhE [Vicinamibacteria bacterium]
MVDAAFERRAARASALAASAEAAREVLSFAAGLLRAQGRVARGLAEAHRRHPLTGRLAADAPRVVEACEAVLRFAAGTGLPGLAPAAQVTARDLVAYWKSDADGYVARTVLRSYVEVLLAAGVVPEARARPAGCPRCGGPPWVGARRPGPEGDGAARLLCCALCGGEWSIARVRCAACPETDPERLPSFSSETQRGARIEACDTCRRYVKSIDLSLEAEAIPEIDDLASPALDLWAKGQGYGRLEPGLAGEL